MNFLSYKNMINGAIIEEIGDCRFYNFTVADNLVAGFEVGLAN